MQKFNIKKQVGKLYGITATGYFQIAGGCREIDSSK